MNSYEKEVLRSQLEAEMKTLLRLKKVYEQAAKDVSEKLEISNGKIEILLKDIENADDATRSVLQSQIYQRDFQKNLRAQLDLLLEDLNDNQYRSISEYLENSYGNGFAGTLYSLNMSDIPVILPIEPQLVVKALYINSKLSKKLYDKLGEDVEYLKKRISNNISRGISASLHYNDIARNIANNSNTGFNNAMRIVRTEGNRIYNAASLDSAKAAKEKTGADLVKVWDSLLDSLTRPRHRQLDGQVRELDEDFEISGYKASAPGHFGIAAEDINCRCVALTKPRWDIDGPFTKRDNQSGELLEFQDAKSYEEFKEKFWKTVDNDGGSGIIKVGSEEMYRKSHEGKIEPMPKKQFRKIEKAFKAKGGIIQYDDATDEYLKNKNAEAITYNETTILIRKNAGRASIFEELIHTAQYRSGENDGSYLSRLKCEISAQKKLLKNAKAYKLTEPEIIQTKKALQAYKYELDEYIKNGGV